MFLRYFCSYFTICAGKRSGSRSDEGLHLILRILEVTTSIAKFLAPRRKQQTRGSSRCRN